MITHQGRSVMRVLVGGSVWALLLLLAFGASTKAQADSVRLAVIGDYGLDNSRAAEVAQLVRSWSPDFVVTTGDNNYPNGAAETIDQNIGQFYHDFIFPYRGAYGTGAATNRFFPVLGNHDWDTPGAAPYLDYFTLPGNERYYDVVLGPVHLFVVDSDPREPDNHGEGEHPQESWLKARLAESTALWKIVAMHHPPYSSGPHGSSSWMQWRFEPWGADAVLSGHDHLYERVTKRQFPYFVNGLGGQARYEFQTPVAGSQARFNTAHGAMLVEADDARLSFRFVTTAGETIDTYTLYAAPKTVSPAAPSGLVATVVSGAEVDLAWADNSSNETHMVVEQSTDGVNFSSLGDLDANATSYSVTGLAERTTYQFRAVARNSDFRSPPSAPVSATTGPAGPPAVPTGLVAKGASPTEIAVTWGDGSDNERGFIVEQLTGESWTPIASAPRNATQLMLGGLSGDVTYILRLRAYNAYGTSEPSNTVTAQTATIFALIETNGTSFSEEDTIIVRLTAANPPGNPPLDLYVGSLWPDLNTIAFLSAPNTFGGLGQYDAPATVGPMATIAPGFSVSGQPILTFTFPTEGIPVGTYYVFASLFRQGSLADNQADDGDLVWLGFVPVTYRP